MLDSININYIVQSMGSEFYDSKKVISVKNIDVSCSIH